MSIYLIFLIVSAIFSAITYFATNSFILSGIILVIFILYFYLFAIKKVKSYISQIHSFQDCYNFINSYLVSLSITSSNESSFKSSIEGLSSDFKSSYQMYENKDSNIESLKPLFPYDVYTLFVDTVHLYEDEGGNVLTSSEYLLKEVRNVEDYMLESTRLAKRSVFDFVLLWAISLSILVFIRIALVQFYSRMIANNIYIVGVVVVFLFLLISVHILLLRITKLDIGGLNDEQAKTR